jgi:hypothetical protein
MSRHTSGPWLIVELEAQAMLCDLDDLPNLSAALRAVQAKVAELIAAAREVERDASVLGMTTPRLTAALAACADSTHHEGASPNPAEAPPSQLAPCASPEPQHTDQDSPE